MTPPLQHDSAALPLLRSVKCLAPSSDKEAAAASDVPLLVRTFARKGHAQSGSLVAVRFGDQTLSEELCRRLAVEDHHKTHSTCTVFAVPSGASSYAVRWFSSAGIEYKCCGHGNMAVGFEVCKLWGAPRSAAVELMSVHSPTARIDICEDGKVETCLDTAGDAAFNAAETEVSPLLCDALQLEPSHVSFQGSWSLGIIVLTSAAAKVRELAPDFRKLCQLDARNVVVASFEGLEDDHDFVFRVFCPRLGVPEDIATGTSMAVVTELFSKRFGCEGEWLRGLQASSSPSELEAKFCQLRPSPVIRLRGQCEGVDAPPRHEVISL
uniref:Uncharacterized protein n=1 Tax=Alexandrium monilatum TaxID=311494 RepID=A0A7S4S7R9_9DINO